MKDKTKSHPLQPHIPLPLPLISLDEKVPSTTSRNVPVNVTSIASVVLFSNNCGILSQSQQADLNLHIPTLVQWSACSLDLATGHLPPPSQQPDGGMV